MKFWCMMHNFTRDLEADGTRAYCKCVMHNISTLSVFVVQIRHKVSAYYGKPSQWDLLLTS